MLAAEFFVTNTISGWLLVLNFLKLKNQMFFILPYGSLTWKKKKYNYIKMKNVSMLVAEFFVTHTISGCLLVFKLLKIKSNVFYLTLWIPVSYLCTSLGFKYFYDE